jgi:hypothetical protein
MRTARPRSNAARKLSASKTSFTGRGLAAPCPRSWFRDEYDQYQVKYPDACDTLQSGQGRLLLFEEWTSAGEGRQVDVTLPILKGETDRFHDKDELALVLANRYNGLRSGRRSGCLLRVAVPRSFRDGRSSDPRRCASVTPLRTQLRGRTRGSVVAKRPSEAMPRVLLKTVIRGITKYLATRGAEKKTGDVGGFLANLLTAATERADTRGWITLPNDIQMARLAVPAGSHNVALRFLDADGAVVDTAGAGEHVFAPGKRVYLSWRGWY